MMLASLSALFRSLAEPARLRLLHLLCRAELSVGELVTVLGLPQSTVSRHLKVLREQGLVTDRPEGVTTFYRACLEPEPNNGESPVREAVRALLADSPLPAADQQRLERALALREREGDDFFDRLGRRWDALRESCFGSTLHFEALLRLLPQGWTVADLGTGTGYLLPSLGAQFKRVIGVDQSEQMLAFAQRRVEEAGARNVELRAGKIEDLPIKNQEADLALALLMLHHMADLERALAEIARVLRPGGQALIVELHPYDNESFRTHMGDRRAGIAPEVLREKLEAAGLHVRRQWDFPVMDHPEHELAPLPSIYGLVCQAGEERVQAM